LALDLSVAGRGGLVVEDTETEVEACSRTMAEYFLRGLPLTRQPIKFLLSAASHRPGVRPLPADLARQQSRPPQPFNTWAWISRPRSALQA
jgi:hypothetical protein